MLYFLQDSSRSGGKSSAVMCWYTTKGKIQPNIEIIEKGMFRSIQQKAVKSFSLKYVSLFLFVLNCLIEMLLEFKFNNKHSLSITVWDENEVLKHGDLPQNRNPIFCSAVTIWLLLHTQRI